MHERHGLLCASITVAALWSFPAVAELPTHPAVAFLGPTPTESQLSDDPEAPFPLNDAGFGSAVAIRNDIALVGIPAALPTGHVAVYGRTATGWRRTATLSVSDPVPAGSFRNGFGRALAFRDGLAVIASSSFVHVFKRGSGVWTHVQKLDLNLDPRAISAMHFENGILAIGWNPSTGSGLVLVYELAANGKFVKRATLRAPGGSPGFGAAVGLAGNTLAVGGADNAVYVFRRKTDGTWVRTQKLIGADSSPVDSFGAAVAIDQGLLIVGAPNHDCIDGVGLFLCGGQSPDTGAGGAAYGFVPFNGQYVQVFKLRPNAQEHRFYWKFGRRIAMMGRYVVIDAAEQAYARDPDISPGDILGLSFTYSRDGSTLTARGIVRDFIESDAIGLANNWLVVGSTHELGIGCISEIQRCAGDGRIFDLNRFAK